MINILDIIESLLTKERKVYYDFERKDNRLIIIDGYLLGQFGSRTKILVDDRNGIPWFSFNSDTVPWYKVDPSTKDWYTEVKRLLEAMFMHLRLRKQVNSFSPKASK